MRVQALAVGLLAGQSLCSPARLPREDPRVDSSYANAAELRVPQSIDRRSPQFLDYGYPPDPRPFRDPGFGYPALQNAPAYQNAPGQQLAPAYQQPPAQQNTITATATQMVTVTTLVTVLTLTTVITEQAPQVQTPQAPVPVAAVPAPARPPQAVSPRPAQAVPAWVLSYSASAAAQASLAAHAPPAPPPPAQFGPSQTSNSYNGPSWLSGGGGGGGGAGSLLSSLFGGGGGGGGSQYPAYDSPPAAGVTPAPTPTPTQSGLSGMLYGSQAPGWAQLVGTLLFGPAGATATAGGSGSGFFGGAFPTDLSLPRWRPRPRPDNDQDDDSGPGDSGPSFLGSGGGGGGGYDYPLPNYIPEVYLPNGSVTTTVTFKSWKPRLSDPSQGPSFQIILSGVPELPDDAESIVPDVDIYDIDLFLTDKRTIDKLHRMGKTVVCYFSAGTYEPGRPDSYQFNSTDIGMPLAQWPKERWISLPSERIRAIMRKRIALAHAKGCDAIDPDNVDGYQTFGGGGIGLTAKDTIDYVKFLSNEATLHGMATGLKNALDILPAVAAHVHFAVNEECVKNRECSKYNEFLRAYQKPVFHIEYPPPPRPKPPPPPPPSNSTNGTVVPAPAVQNTASTAASGFSGFLSEIFQGRQEGGGPRVTALELTKLEPEDREYWCDRDTYAGRNPNFSTVLKMMSLNGFVEYCNGKYAVTPTRSSGNSHYDRRR